MIKRRFRMMLAMVLLATLGATLPAASAAQLSPQDLLKRLDGIETAYARKYISDRDLGFVTPVISDAADPETMTVTVLEFETDAQAESAFRGMLNEFVVKMIIGKEEIDLEMAIVDDLGDAARLYTGVDEHFIEPQEVAFLAVRDGNLGILIQAYGTDPAITSQAMDFATFMVAAEPGTGSLNLEGLFATGGTFDIMPSVDDTDLLHGLIPMYDYDLINGGNHPLHHTATPAAMRRSSHMA